MGKIKGKQKKQRNNKRSWRGYLKRKYGDNPTCEVCEKILKWDGKRNEIVVFDHKTGNEKIYGSPSNWMRNHYCNEENIAFWEQCDFGILCNRCNCYLPTKDRRLFVSSIVRYVFGL